MDYDVKLRTEYALAELTEADLDRDPIRQFGLWFDRALQAKVPEPNAMVLATATGQGFPSARVVLLKHFDEHGFVFFTNYESPKGRDLEQNPQAALVLFWPALERQVRISGPVTKTSREESDYYFHSRPIESQLGAWASHQSAVLSSREELDAQFRQVALEHEGKPVPLPPCWGGFRVRPLSIEFWQGRVSRLHDRLRYTRQEGEGWRIERLAP
jgi:pyridoxamine 5'-phosphate oxidase